MSNGKKPTVLQVLPALNMGGVERGTLEIVEALVDQGSAALVASSGGLMEHRLEKRGGIHFRLPLRSKNPLTIWANVERLKRIIRDYNVDIVHARSRAPAWSAYYAAKACGVPFITTFHGVYSHGNPFKRRYNRVMTRGEKIIAPSHYVADHIVRTYRVDREKIVLIPRGVDMNVFAPEAVPTTRVISLARQWQLPDDRPFIILPGRITRLKGHNLTIEALRILTRTDYMCLFVGPYEENGYIRDLERKLVRYGLSEQVRFVGSASDMAAVYQLGDVILIPSLRPESFGRTAAEAMAMGRVVVVADQGGLAEVVDDAGFRFRPQNVADLAETIDAALNLSAAQRQAMAKKAQQRIKKSFTLRQMQASTLQLYDGLI